MGTVFEHQRGFDRKKIEPVAEYRIVADSHQICNIAEGPAGRQATLSEDGKVPLAIFDIFVRNELAKLYYERGRISTRSVPSYRDVFLGDPLLLRVEREECSLLCRHLEVSVIRCSDGATVYNAGMEIN